MRNVEFEWFSDYLFNSKQLVNYNITFFESGLVPCGVPQWSNLGPLLFIIFAKNIVDPLRNSRIIKYANDTVLYLVDKTLK